MSRGGFADHQRRSFDEPNFRSGRFPPERGAPPDVPAQLAANAMKEEALYADLCPSDGETLPPGWEKVVYHETVVYLDHVAREAHEVTPWEVWRRRSGAGS